MASRSDILDILETRYDHISARIIFNDVLAATKLDSKAKYEKAEATKIANALIRVGSRVERVVDRIRALDANKSAKAAPAPVESTEAAPAEVAEKAPAQKAKKTSKKKS